MPKPLLLHRPSGLHVRFFVPAFLQPSLSRRYVVLSLRRQRADAARLRAAQIGYVLAQLFERMRSTPVTDHKDLLAKALAAARGPHVDLTIELPGGVRIVTDGSIRENAEARSLALELEGLRLGATDRSPALEPETKTNPEDLLSARITAFLGHMDGQNRSTFSPAELRTIFSPDKIVYALPHKYWTPILALYAGARVNEIGQLHVEDVEEIEGIWGLHIRRKTKNQASRRLVPLHPELIRLGLLDYVNDVRKAGFEHVFPGLTWGDNGPGERWPPLGSASRPAPVSRRTWIAACQCPCWVATPLLIGRGLVRASQVDRDKEHLPVPRRYDRAQRALHRLMRLAALCKAAREAPEGVRAPPIRPGVQQIQWTPLPPRE